MVIAHLQDDGERTKSEAVKTIEKVEQAIEEERNRSQAEVVGIEAEANNVIMEAENRLREALDTANFYLELAQSLSASHLEEKQDLENVFHTQRCHRRIREATRTYPYTPEERQPAEEGGPRLESAIATDRRR